jgi:hypothetical protein
VVFPVVSKGLSEPDPRVWFHPAGQAVFRFCAQLHFNPDCKFIDSRLRLQKGNSCPPWSVAEGGTIGSARGCFMADWLHPWVMIFFHLLTVPSFFCEGFLDSVVINFLTAINAPTERAGEEITSATQCNWLKARFSTMA